MAEDLEDITGAVQEEPAAEPAEQAAPVLSDTNTLEIPLYEAMAARIKALVPEVRWIEMDYGQLQYEQPPVDFPAVLIDFTATQYADILASAQTGDVSIRVSVVMATFSQSYVAAPADVRAKALECFNLERKVAAALHGWCPDSGICTPLARRSVQTANHPEIGVRVRDITFATSFEEYLVPD